MSDELKLALFFAVMTVFALAGCSGRVNLKYWFMDRKKKNKPPAEKK